MGIKNQDITGQFVSVTGAGGLIFCDVWAKVS